MLEEKLSHQPDSMVSSMVQKQFRGQYEYVTRFKNFELAAEIPNQNAFT